MVTASVLAAIRRLEDLPELVLALGQEPVWEELPLPGWLDLTPGRDANPLSPLERDAERRGSVTRAAVVGRAGEFPWFGAEAADPARAARAIARRLVARGRVGGVLAVSRAGRRLAVAVAFGEAPCLDCGLDDPGRVTLTRFARLGAVSGGPALAVAARAADALGAEAVGRRFFRCFRSTLETMCGSLPRSFSRDDRHALALLQLTRVLFLYFVQSKGWLDGCSGFLSREVDRCLGRGRHLQRDLLHPLFFGTLNRPAPERSRLARTFGRIPFLNGGLFEPHPLERRHRAGFSNAIWREAFDALFERFDFTADESGRPGLVAPDMLGRVFEGVMEPGLRRQSGTFYTPAALVRSIVRAGLVAYLSEDLSCPESRAERHLAERSEPARRALSGLTVLDPAVGSGAFLLGVLDLLAEVEAGGRASSAARRRVLGRSLFGVDLNPAAVRLTELRLWLAVIADDAATDAAAIEPLPNLDCLVRQGDSLLDPGGRWPGGRAPLADATVLAKLRRELVAAAGPDKRGLARELRRRECRAFADALDGAESALEAEIAARLEDARAPTLLDPRRGLDTALRAEVTRLRRERRAVRVARRRLRREGELPWFHYQSQFADVFAAGGFDLVVGNPPWVRAEQLAPELRERLATRYRWWRGGRGTRGFAGRPDLALAFLERAWELARPGGAVALLVPAKVAAAGYASRARHALAAEATIRAAADLTGAPEAAFDATVYPLALVATKAPAPADHRVRSVLRPPRSPASAGVPQRDLIGGGPWTLAPGPALSALKSLAEHPRLGQRFVCHLGVKTGANDLFLDPPATVEPELVRWAIRGRDIRPFRADPVRRLLWPCDAAGRPLPHLPPGVSAHLAPRFARLRARADDAGGPPWTLFRTTAACAPYRVVWADLARRLTALALTTDAARELIPLNTCYVVAAPDADAALCLAAWLNVSWVRAAARLVAPPAAGGFARFNARVVGALPLPDSALRDPILADLARAGTAGHDVQAELDALAASRLALAPAAARALAAVERGADHRR